MGRYESSGEAPSHRECHCTAPGSARTSAPRAWKQPGTQGRVQPSQRGTCIFKLICQTLRPLTHLHMSPAVAAQEVMQGDRSYAAAPGSLEGRSHHVTGKETEKCLSFSRQPPMTQPSQLPERKHTKFEEFKASACGFPSARARRRNGGVPLNARWRLRCGGKHVPDAPWRTY